jgi:hypothetical protein
MRLQRTGNLQVSDPRNQPRSNRGPTQAHLRSRDYGGWHVLEQDTILTEEPRGEGPVADVRQSADYLRTLLTASP